MSDPRKLTETEMLERIAALESELAEAKRRAKDARNELCYKCGRYHEEHLGACNGCKWRGPIEGEGKDDE